jgi:hypothetical protein
MMSHPVLKLTLIGLLSLQALVANEGHEVGSAFYLEPIKVPAWWKPGETIKYRPAGGMLPANLLSVEGIVTDSAGREVKRVTTEKGKLERTGWEWKPEYPGYYEVSFSYTDTEGKVLNIARPYIYKPPRTISRSFPRIKQGFAVVTDSLPPPSTIGQFGFSATASGDPRELELAELIGFDLVRLLCGWGANMASLERGIESVRGAYNWKAFDEAVRMYGDAGFIMNAQICYTPLWASPHPEKTNVNICVVEGTTFAPTEMKDFSDFVETAVARYQDRIHLWELWNEPSVPGGSIFWSDTPENFVRLLETGYRAVKKIQPNAQVWIGGLGPRSPYHVFYNRVLQLGGGHYFDVLSLHGAWNTPAEKFREIDAVNNVPSKSAVSGEWHAILQGNMQTGPILSETELSFKMMKDLLYQLKEGVTRTIVFEMLNLTEIETLPFAIENKIFVHSSGLFRRRPQIEPRHAGVIMANFVRIVGRQATYVREFNLEHDTVAIELQTREGHLVAFFSETVALPLSVVRPFITEKSKLRDWEGKEIPLNATDRLESGKLYYLTSINTSATSQAELTNRLISPQTLARASHKAIKGNYITAPLFKTAADVSSISDELWISPNWKLTQIKPSPSATDFSAMAAIGAHPGGLDIVVDVQDAIHFQNETEAKWWHGDSIQIAIDCESSGVTSGSTEIVAALTAKGPITWKILAADPKGDIPALWSTANSYIKHMDASIARVKSKTRYQLRIPWSELYPLTYDPRADIRMSIVVNNNNGDGRCAILEWGEGIAKGKDPFLFGCLAAVPANK